MSQHASRRSLLPLRQFTVLAMVAVVFGTCLAASRPAAAADDKWVATWTATQHGPYPSGIAALQPDLRLVFPDKTANDQTFRLIVKPDLWGSRMRFRFSNEYGDRPLVLDEVFIGVQASGGNLVPGTNRRVLFSGANRVTIPVGARTFSDGVSLDFVKRADSPELAGRNLAVSFHVVGSSGRMTWYSGALRTSYLSGPKSGAHSADADDLALPFTTVSWYFLDTVEVMAPKDTIVVAAFGDSITKGANSTHNGDDRWSNALSTRLHAALGTKVSVVTQAVGGNQVIGPKTYDPNKPYFGGPSAIERLDRDLLGVSGLTHVVWLEGTNDIGQPGNAVEQLKPDSPDWAKMPSPEEVIAGFREGVRRLRAKGIKVIGTTLMPAQGLNHSTPEGKAARAAINTFIRTGGAFDGVVDFEAATVDPATGDFRAEFLPSSTDSSKGDHIHPNRAGYQAMAKAIDLTLFAPNAARSTRKGR